MTCGTPAPFANRWVMMPRAGRIFSRPAAGVSSRNAQIGTVPYRFRRVTSFYCRIRLRLPSSTNDIVAICIKLSSAQPTLNK
jgi:hypothetical protein